MFLYSCSEKEAEPRNKFESIEDHISTDLHLIDGSSGANVSCSNGEWHGYCIHSPSECCYRIRSAEPPYVYRYECRTCPNKGVQTVAFFAGLDLNSSQQSFHHMSIIRHMKASLDTLGTYLPNTLDSTVTLAFVDDEIPSGFMEETVLYEICFFDSLDVMYSSEEYYYIPPAIVE